MDFKKVKIENLKNYFGFNCDINYPKESLKKEFKNWKMEDDDAPIFRYLYNNLSPKRHLEFGTWQGQGVLYCLEESRATVWTVNPPFGELKEDGYKSYGYFKDEYDEIKNWANKVGLVEKERIGFQTDSLGFIGRKYLEKEYGNRVCQIYSDSVSWDISNYSENFFDTVLIDGGHTVNVVKNDTLKAFKLVKSGGVVMWHDFCPPLIETNDNAYGVDKAFSELDKFLDESCSDRFWIYPSFIYVAIKK